MINFEIVQRHSVRIQTFFKSTSFLFLVGLIACRTPENQIKQDSTLFRLLSSAESGINFENTLPYTEQLNTYTFKNFYSGGGVGLGDFNNDSLIDIFFAGNLVPSKLYLNKGNLTFQDITTSAGLDLQGAWTTGVSVVDINGDGLLDIYLCKSGPPGGPRRYNELFINKGDLTFVEQSKIYGLAYEGLSMHAAFFDSDKDGDLDCYLLNNSLRSVGGYDLRIGQRKIPDPLGGNRFLRNDNGHFVDVTIASGIYSSEIGFGLGVTIGDINRDGWQDMYVSNDFFEKDYLYINQRNGTFSEDLEAYMQEISLGSMGADMADLNNDGLPEVFVTEMLPEGDDRLKTTTQFESWSKYDLNVKNGYHRQFSRNTLQLNNGNGSFSEIGRFAGVDATDWSWGALMFDMDNDGSKDIFVANGIYKELLNQDYVNFSSNPEIIRKIQQKIKGVLTELIDSIPSHPIANYAFRNMGNLTFENRANDWGLGALTYSNGSAYGDLDNDGDLDLVINNANMPAMIYENRVRQFLPQNGSLSIALQGEGKNTYALGAQVTLKVKGKILYQEQSPMRGFMSTVDSRMVFGLGDSESVDTLMVEWPNNTVSVLTNVKANQLVRLAQKNGIDGAKYRKQVQALSPVFISQKLKGVDFIHKENDFVDFDRDRLLFNMVSNEGPCLCSGDINADGLFDFYIGGAKGQPGALYTQMNSGNFRMSNAEVFAFDKDSEDTDCIFFDANGDGALDLYVTSGGFEFSTSSTALMDRLYLNSGNGKLIRGRQALPVSGRFESTSTVAEQDYDKDGAIDLFVGVRLIPFAYGVPGNGYILKNDGKGNFSNVTDKVAPELAELGLITDAKWTDINNDGHPDLIIVGEWMSIRVFINENGKFVDRSEAYGLIHTDGWYHTVEVGDFNKDGFMDFVVGNHGLNSRFKATDKEPVSMYVNDFDQNGSIEHITTHYDQGVSYPLILKPDLVAQLPYLKRKFLRYRDYKGKTISDIFDTTQLRTSVILNAYTFETSVWLNSGRGTFSKKILPPEAQYFPVYAMAIEDFTNDGKLDILLGGNQFRAKPETGIYAAGYGLLLRGDGRGEFSAVHASESGLAIRGEIRSLKKVKYKGEGYILVARNDAEMDALRYEQKDNEKK